MKVKEEFLESVLSEDKYKVIGTAKITVIKNEYMKDASDYKEMLDGRKELYGKLQDMGIKIVREPGVSHAQLNGKDSQGHYVPTGSKTVISFKIEYDNETRKKVNAVITEIFPEGSIKWHVTVSEKKKADRKEKREKELDISWK